MIAQCVTSAVLFGTGDVIAQQAIEKKGLKNHDVSPLLPLSWLFCDTTCECTHCEFWDKSGHERRG
jgi:hypothetical protein